MKVKIWKYYSNIIWLFFIGSFFGFIYENTLLFLKGRNIITRGLLYEPLIPIYGLGLLLFYCFYLLVKNKKYDTFDLFIIFTFVGGCFEYILSFVQEKIFGTISWNYSHIIFNFNGRTSLFHALFWGLTFILGYKYLFPMLEKSKSHLEHHFIKILTLVLTIILILDISISLIACCRQNERRNNIYHNTPIERFLDKYYSDERISKAYPNAIIIKKVA